jgi:hypothetical protein
LKLPEFLPQFRVVLFRTEISIHVFIVLEFTPAELYYLMTLSVLRLYRVSQEERSVFWQVIGLVILSKQKSVYVHVSYNEWFPR